MPVKDVDGTLTRPPTFFGDEVPSSIARELGPPRRIDPAYQETPKDPTRPAVSDSMFKVGIGLRFVILDAFLSGLIYMILLTGPFLLAHIFPNMILGPIWFRTLAALQWLWVLVMLFGMTGRLLCLLIPGESQAKPYIFTSILLEFFFLSITMMDISRGIVVPREALIAGQICQLFAHVLFHGFLRQLAAYLKREDLHEISQRSFGLGAVFVVAAIMATLSRFFFQPGIAQLFFICNFLAGPMLFISYLRLLHQFRVAVDDLQ